MERVTEYKLLRESQRTRARARESERELKERENKSPDIAPSYKTYNRLT
jgi:hypothetical protein